MRGSPWRAAVTVALLVMAAVVAGAVAPGTARAQRGAGVPLPADAAERVSSDLVGIRLRGAAYERAVGAYVEAGQRLDEVRRTRTVAVARLGALEHEDARLTARIAAFSAIEQVAAAELAAAQHRLEQVAVVAYVSWGPARRLAFVLDSTDIGDVDRRTRLLDAVHTDQREARDRHRAARDAASAEVARSVAAQADTRREIAATAARIAEADAGERLWLGELERRRVAIVRTASTAVVVGTDLPLVVLDAYYRAAQRLAARRPACGIPWEAVAGIGRIESHHGTYGGGRVDEHGNVRPQIIGIALDGTNSTRVIADTDGGALDGDARGDRAVGPLQFIPETWRRFGVDGNGDGRADPHNLYDAAVSTAGYLCRGAPGGMRDDAGKLRAFFAYNQSEQYGRDVLAWTHRYGANGLPIDRT